MITSSATTIGPLFSNRFRVLGSAVFILCLVFSVFAFSNTAHANPKYASIVMDADTGVILHQRHANKSLHPASLTKVMTLLMAFDAMEQGKLGLRDRIRISKRAASMVPSKLGLPAGSSIRVQDAIYALVTKSANDVAVAMAEHLAGSERNFAKRMTSRAREIGMSRTTFRNASGLHDKRQVTTARDMAKMARYVIIAYPTYYRYFSRQNFSYNGKSYRNHNRLMKTYAGMDGMKTGYINASGFNLIASAVRKDRRIIGVVFGGRSSKTRNAHMKTLLDNGFNKAKNIRVAKAKVPVPPRKPVPGQVLAAVDPAISQGMSEQARARAAAASPRMDQGFGEIIGQGDYDGAAAARIETGLMAVAAHTGQRQAYSGSTSAKVVSHRPAAQVRSGAPWSVQIGAFKSRAATDSAIQKTLKSLPSPYSSAQPLIAPMKTSSGWLFRARLTGYSKEQALAACNFIRDCLPVAPTN